MLHHIVTIVTAVILFTGVGEVQFQSTMDVQTMENVPGGKVFFTVERFNGSFGNVTVPVSYHEGVGLNSRDFDLVQKTNLHFTHREIQKILEVQITDDEVCRIVGPFR